MKVLLEAGAEAPVIPLYLYKCDQCTGKVVFKSLEGNFKHSTFSFVNSSVKESDQP